MSLSRDDIKKYKSSKRGSEKNTIEMQTLDNAFENDALEGWSNPELSIYRLKKMDRRFHRSGLKFYLFTSLILILCAGFGILYYFSKYSKTTNNPSVITINQSVKKEDKTQTIHQDGIKKFESLPLKLQIKPKTVKKDFQAKATFDSKEINHSTDFSNEQVKLPLKKVKKIVSEIKQRTNVGRETYLQNLKIIDYRYYRTRPIEDIKNPLTGTPAENETQIDEATKEKSIIGVSYISFLEKSLKLFNASEFRNALFRFETILETYPDDVNALFYSSICLYNLNQFELCKKRLLQLESARFTNFDQEQQWYLLLTYKAEGNKESFENTRSSIINLKGFYSKKANNINFYQ